MRGETAKGTSQVIRDVFKLLRSVPPRTVFANSTLEVRVHLLRPASFERRWKSLHRPALAMPEASYGMLFVNQENDINSLVINNRVCYSSINGY